MELVYVRDLAEVSPERALERAVDYLLGRGYLALGGASTELRFGRGRALAGLYTMTRMDRLPTRLSLCVRAQGDGSEVDLRYDVGTFGQLVTETNRRFWDVEVDDLLDHIRGHAEPRRWTAYERAARRDAVVFVLISLVTAVACCGIAMLLYRYTT